MSNWMPKDIITLSKLFYIRVGKSKQKLDKR